MMSNELPHKKTDKGKQIVTYNAFDILRDADEDADELIRGPNMQPLGDYSGPGNRIWIAWNDDFIDVDILNIGSQFVHCRVLKHDIHEPILLTVVYGANEVSARRELWQGLTEQAVSVNLPWLVGGDFNAVLDMSEVSGASGDIRVAMHEFNDCIIQTGLIPFLCKENDFHGTIVVRMEGAFGRDWTACLLMTHGWSDGRIFSTPALHHGFLASVHNIWQQSVFGTPMYSVTRKLKALKPVFRQQRRKKGDLAMNVKLAAGFLEIAQKLLQVDRHNSLYCNLRTAAGGDQCSKVFFRRVATRRANKRLFQISDSDGLVQTDPNIINNVFVTYFQDLLGGDRTERVLDLHYLRPWARHILTEEEANALIRPVTVDDVKKAMFDIEEDKAPGPDGFSSGFYKAAWPIVGEEISKAIMDFFTTGKLLKQVNATVLTLIPKVRTPHSVADFRPISCCNVIYKVISKILVCRFREILDLLISPSQNAFIPGRLISDNVLLAQELFSGYNQCRLPPRCALKVDLRKAYDTVEWDFLFATLRLFGFPAVFIRWIEECVTSAHYSVVVNGGVHGFFAGARGLRQGDPMSPYLFVLVMEVLQMILQQFIDQDGQFLYHWRCTELKLFQLSFADDLLLLCKADVQSVNLFRRGLDLFASLSGLHTNPQKSQLIISKAASGLRIHYLRHWGFRSRIKGWEGVMLSFAGRVQLIKSVLVSLEVYWAMAFILPKGIINEMIKRLRSFLWKGTSSSGYPKVAWEDVCRPIEEGGQGIKDIFALNRAMMCKHLWAVIKQDRTSIWVDWIYQVRLRDCSIWTAKDNKGAWGWRKMLTLRHTLLSHIHFRIGDGTSFLLGMIRGTH
ncbi:UNVERIFIED_CONTAM: Retrovirus-related Pol polyprotein from type-2 retrotransposable element R2DM [Sesamum angustifolium]|uniref:Retrovirus-related Pol polyprotein from type-2 retrotransposable element R2DM n=1 Tax=Sesamum angustifolium TaxID=2727405 RepID=A0AAW2K0X4_9LAMI